MWTFCHDHTTLERPEPRADDGPGIGPALRRSGQFGSPLDEISVMMVETAGYGGYPALAGSACLISFQADARRYSTCPSQSSTIHGWR